MEDIRYLYYINPRKPIKNINEDIKIIRIPHSYYLTKEEVFKCLGNAIVYRRFSNEDIYEKVNKYNIDRLHNAKFINEKDWEILLSNNTVIVEDEKPSTIEEVVAIEPVIEEVIEKAAEEDPNTIIVKDEDPIEEVIENDVIEESAAEETVTDEKDFEEVEEKPMPAPKANYNNYNKKKHH